MFGFNLRRFYHEKHTYVTCVNRRTRKARRRKAGEGCGEEKKDIGATPVILSRYHYVIDFQDKRRAAHNAYDISIHLIFSFIFVTLTLTRTDVILYVSHANIDRPRYCSDSG